MPITFSDFLTFPFNGGKGIKQNQVEGLDELAAKITAGAGEKTGYRLLADVRVAHGTDYVVPDFTVLQGADVAHRIVLFQVPRSGGGNDWSWEEHDDIYRFRTETNYGAVSGRVRFWKDAQDRLVLSSPSGTEHVIVHEIYHRDALDYSIRRLIPVLPTPTVAEVGRVVQISSAGEWVSTPPAWEADELDTSVQKRLPPAPSGAGVGKVPAVNAQGSGYALVDAQNSAVSLAGLRIESIELSDQAIATTSVVVAPKVDSISVDHGEGDAEILSNISNTNFTVAEGLYLLSLTGEVNAAKVGRVDFDIRDSTDNAVIVGPTGMSTYNTNGAYQTFTLTGYWHLAAADSVNVYLERHARDMAFRNLKLSLAQLDAESDTDAIEVRAALPDAADVRDDKVFLVDGRLWQKATGQTENTFEGRLDHYSYGSQNFTYDGTSGALGQTGTHGQFTVNPGGAVAAVLNNRRTGHLEIEVRKDTYETAKGSASDSNDQIKAVIKIGSTSETHSLEYVAEYPNGFEPNTILFRSNVHSALLQTAALGAAWSMVITNTDDSDLYTHTATVQHWVEYRLALVADLHAAINAAHDDLETDLRTEIDKLHTYVGHHIADTVEELTDPNAADAPDQVYLVSKGFFGADNIPYEAGLYENTEAVNSRFRVELEKHTLENGSFAYGFNTRGVIGLDDQAPFGRIIHNIDSALLAFYLVGEWYVMLVKGKYYTNVRDNYVAPPAAPVTIGQGTHLWFYMYDMDGSAVRSKFEMGFLGTGIIDSGAANGTYTVGNVQYYLMFEHANTAAAKNKIINRFPQNQDKVIVDIGVNPTGSGDYHDFWTGFNAGDRDSNAGAGTHAWTYRESVDSRIVRNFNTLLDRLAGAADLASIPDANLTNLKIT